jgi:hypothetical protein
MDSSGDGPVTVYSVSIRNLKAVGDVVTIDLPATSVISDGSFQSGSPPLTQTVLAELDCEQRCLG